MAFTTHLTLLKWLIRVVVLAAIVMATIVTVRAFDARKKPDLKPWHRTGLDAEFTAAQAGKVDTLDDILALERVLFEQLHERINSRVDSKTASDVNRYLSGSRADPAHFNQNWNRTYEMRPANVTGAALLLHGLSDSPYSVRHIAEVLNGQGYYVLCLRMPGHGTAPAGLLSATWEDWAAIGEIGMRHVAEQVPDDGRFILGGYSNGGALALNYVADVLTEGDRAMPDQIILFSPMLGVSPFAVLANTHKLLSWIPYFEKSKWVDIYPEYDPFKYNSFPMKAGHESYRLIRTLGRKLEALANTNQMSKFPPVLAFQSLVDATVSTEAIVSKLFDRLEGNDHELILFDVNHLTVLKDFIEPKYDRTALLAAIQQRETLPYKLTVITNEQDDAPQVAARTRPAGDPGETLEHLDLRWPSQVYSLAHVAIPFPASDPVYGNTADTNDGSHVKIGLLNPRGEKGVLNVPSSLMLRLRYNPFFDYVEQRLVQKVTSSSR